MGVALIFAYGLLILFAVRKAMRNADAAGFYVNNRRGSALNVGASILVSCVGASATLGMIGMAFSLGTPAFWWLGAGAIGLILLSVLLAPAVRETGAYTMPQLVESVLGAAARPLISLVVAVAWTAILAAQFSALVQVLQGMTGLAQSLCLGIGFALVVCHTLGGQAAIMRADKVQSVVLIGALLIILAWLWAHNPGWTAAVPLQATNELFPPEKLLYYLVVVGANYLVCPMLFGRLLSARDSQSARRGGLYGALSIAICALVIVSIGLACKGLLPEDTPADAVLTTALSGLLPFWMHLVISLALLSAIVSSADSCLVTAATVLSHDLLGRTDPRTGRLCILALGCAGGLLSLWGKGITGFLLMAYDIYACGVVLPVFIGLLLRRRAKMHSRAACAAIVTGGALGLAAAVTGDNLYSYLGLGTSGGIVLASLVLAGIGKNMPPAARKTA